MFNAVTFSMPSKAQQLKTHLSGSNTGLVFGLLKREGMEQKEITCIAFGHMDKNVRIRLGSVSTMHEDYILVLSMDSKHEFRAQNEHQVVNFLNILSSKGFNWEAAIEQPYLIY